MPLNKETNQPLRLELNVFEKSMNNSFTSKFLAHFFSMIRLITRICDVVDRFLRKPFWFFLRIFSTWVGYDWRAWDNDPLQL